MMTFAIQVLTGMPLKFSEASWSYPLIKLFGGVYMAGRIHRISGLVMALLFAYVLGYIMFTTAQKVLVVFEAQPPENFKDALTKIVMVLYNIPMFPRAKDGKDIVDAIKYFLHISDEPPQYDKFCWKEKFDYLAVFWGIPVFTLTGPLLWWPSFFTNIGVPPVAINIGLVVHGDEAFLALTVIMVWHFYNAIFCPEKFPMDGMVINGTISEEKLIHEYPNEYRRIMTEEGEDGPSIVRPDDE
jgi:cytochrome b subunit of formate dehydrogenase